MIRKPWTRAAIVIFLLVSMATLSGQDDLESIPTIVVGLDDFQIDYSKDVVHIPKEPRRVHVVPARHYYRTRPRDDSIEWIDPLNDPNETWFERPRWLVTDVRFEAKGFSFVVTPDDDPVDIIQFKWHWTDTKKRTKYTDIEGRANKHRDTITIVMSTEEPYADYVSRRNR